MLKLLPTLLCLGVILLACDQKRKASSELDKVIDIQGNLEAKSPDSTLFYHNCQLPTEHWSLNTTYYKTKLLSIIVISRIQMHENEQAVLR